MSIAMNNVIWSGGRFNYLLYVYCIHHEYQNIMPCTYVVKVKVTLRYVCFSDVRFRLSNRIGILSCSDLRRINCKKILSIPKKAFVLLLTNGDFPISSV